MILNQLYRLSPAGDLQEQGLPEDGAYKVDDLREHIRAASSDKYYERVKPHYSPDSDMITGDARGFATIACDFYILNKPYNSAVRDFIAGYSVLRIGWADGCTSNPTISLRNDALGDEKHLSLAKFHEVFSCADDLRFEQIPTLSRQELLDLSGKSEARLAYEQLHRQQDGTGLKFSDLEYDPDSFFDSYRCYSDEFVRPRSDFRLWDISSLSYSVRYKDDTIHDIDIVRPPLDKFNRAYKGLFRSDRVLTVSVCDVYVDGAPYSVLGCKDDVFFDVGRGVDDGCVSDSLRENIKSIEGVIYDSDRPLPQFDADAYLQEHNNLSLTSRYNVYPANAFPHVNGVDLVQNDFIDLGAFPVFMQTDDRGLASSGRGVVFTKGPSYAPRRSVPIYPIYDPSLPDDYTHSFSAYVKTVGETCGFDTVEQAGFDYVSNSYNGKSPDKNPWFCANLGQQPVSLLQLGRYSVGLYTGTGKESFIDTTPKVMTAESFGNMFHYCEHKISEFGPDITPKMRRENALKKQEPVAEVKNDGPSFG